MYTDGGRHEPSTYVYKSHIDSVETRLETRLDSMQQELSAIQSELSSIAQRISYIEGHLSIDRSTPEIENSPAP